MPNWNYNEVTIDAPISEVWQFLVFDNEEYLFNMHKIFPDIFSYADTTGNTNWDYEWACDNTGSKWFPVLLDPFSCEEWVTCLSYDTAWAPNNLTLLKLSEITGWKIENIYEEPGVSFEGTFICKAWKVLLDEEREYRQCCEICNSRYLTEDLPEDAEEHCFCPRCYK